MGEAPAPATDTRRWARVLAPAWTIALAVGLWLPGSATPPVVLGIDKLAHLGGFAVLAALWMWALTGARRTWLVVLGGMAFAVATEVVQGVLPWPRTPELLDVVADGVGVLLGVAVGRARWRNGRDSNPR